MVHLHYCRVDMYCFMIRDVDWLDGVQFSFKALILLDWVFVVT